MKFIAFLSALLATSTVQAEPLEKQVLAALEFAAQELTHSWETAVTIDLEVSLPQKLRDAADALERKDAQIAQLREVLKLWRDRLNREGQSGKDDEEKSDD